MAPWESDSAIGEDLGKPVVIGRRFFGTLAQLDVAVPEIQKKIIVSSEDQGYDSACVPRFATAVSSTCGVPKFNYHMLCVRFDDGDLATAREELRELKSHVKLGDTLEWTQELYEKLIVESADSTIFGASGTTEKSGCWTVEVRSASLKVAEERVWDMSRIDKIRQQRDLLGSSQGATGVIKPSKSKSRDSGHCLEETGAQERALVSLKQNVDAAMTNSCAATTPSTAPPSPGATDTDVKRYSEPPLETLKSLSNPKLVRRFAGPPVSADAAAFCDWLHNGPMQRILERLKNLGHDEEKLNCRLEDVNNKDTLLATVTTNDYTKPDDMALESSILSQCRSILDVAGGKGELSSLLLEAGIPGRALHIVDPKANAGGLSRARRKWMRRQGISEPMGVMKEYFQVKRVESRARLAVCADSWTSAGADHLICSDVPTHDSSTTQQLQVRTGADGQTHLTNLNDSPDSVLVTPLSLVPDDVDRLADASPLVLGLHPDQATDDIVDYCVSRQKPFAVVPCCVFGRQFPLRRYWEYVADETPTSRTGNITNGLDPDEPECVPKKKRYFPVYSRPQLIRYLVQKHPSIKTDVLENCPGANVVVYCTFEDAGPAPTQ